MRAVLSLLVLVALAHSALAAQEKMMVGGVSESTTNVDAGAAEAAQKAVLLLNADAGKRALALGSAQGGEVSLLAVTSVRTQVVAGINYFLTLKLADSSSNEAHEVHVTVWSRPWLENSNSGEQAWQLTNVERV